MKKGLYWKWKSLQKSFGKIIAFTLKNMYQRKMTHKSRMNHIVPSSKMKNVACKDKLLFSRH